MVLGGRAPSGDFLSTLSEFGDVWAVDRGVDACRAAGVAPKLLVGDFDSASGESRSWALKLGVPVSEYQKDKDMTDFQLALEIFKREHKSDGTKLFLTGAFGGRFDHLWSLLISFMNLVDDEVPFCIADEIEGLLILKGPDEYSLNFQRIPKALSLISFSEQCLGVSISGVRWPLADVELKYSFPYAVSNRLDSGANTKIACSSGTLGAYWVWNE